MISSGTINALILLLVAAYVARSWTTLRKFLTQLALVLLHALLLLLIAGRLGELTRRGDSAGNRAFRLQTDNHVMSGLALVFQYYRMQTLNGLDTEDGRPDYQSGDSAQGAAEAYD